MQLHEQYRPARWQDVIAQKRVLRRIERIRARGFGGRAFWISGASGTGKTTIARLIATDVADEWSIEEVDASGLTIARLNQLERESHCFGLGEKSGRVYIVNEAHAMSKPIVRQFLTTLERLPGHVVWIFTTTVEGQRVVIDGGIDGAPLLSRCVRLDLDTTGLEIYFAKRVARIARVERIGKRSSGFFVPLVRKHNCNLRSVLQDVEAGAIEEMEATA